jgi:K+-sensing histidine kinase KdpD
MDPQVAGVLGAVLEAVGDASGYPDVLSRICQALVDAVPCERVTIYTWSNRHRTYLPRADVGTPAHVVERFLTRGFRRESVPEMDALGGRRLVAASRGAGSPEMQRVLEDAEISALAMVPLEFDGHPEGTISCALTDEAAFRPEQLAALERVASHVALLVRNARLESAAARLAARRTWLATGAGRVLTATDALQLAHHLGELSQALFRATGAWLLLVEGDALVGRKASEPDLGTELVRLPLHVTAASTDALRERRVVVVNDYTQTPYMVSDAAQRFHPASVLVIPLVDDTGPMGVVVVNHLHDPRRFGRTDEEDAQILATIATAALRKALLLDALTRANQAKNDFLASVSHDLRTPLNIITGYASLLREETFGALTDEQGDVLSRILRTAGDQLALINDLLDLARIERGELVCAPRPLVLAALVPALADMMEVLLRGRPIRFEADVAPDVVVRADPERMRQVLVNLLGNAAKFTREGCVRLVAAAGASDVRVAVEDTGPGIAPAIRDRVLKPFVRGAVDGAGTGLGLAIVSRLLDAMHGAIAIESEPGRGTRVEVRLPPG